MSFGNIVGSASFQLLTGKRGFTLGLQDAQREAEGAVGKISASLAGLGRAASQAGLALTGGLTAPLAGLTTAVFNIGSSFESAFAGVEKTFPGTNEQLAQFRDSIREMANEMPSTREEIAGVAEAAGQLGISATGLEDFTRTMVQLGETTNLSATEAATNLARLANILQTNEQDFDRLGATVVDLGNNFATTEAEIVNMATRIAGAGQVVGLTESQVLALSTALSSVGVRIEAGGSAISRVFITMANAVAQGGEDLELFAHTANTSVGDFAQAFETDATKALQLFLTGLNEIEEQGGNVFTTLDDLELGEIRVRDALLRLASAQDVLTDALGRGDSAWQDNNALVEEYEKRVKTVESQVQILKNQFSDIAVSIFDAFRPEIIAGIEKVGEFIESLTERVTGFIDSLDSDTKKFIVSLAGVAAAIGPLTLAIGGLGIAMATLINPFSLAVIALGAVAAAFILVETNSAFMNEQFPTATAHIESLKESFEGLGVSLEDVAWVLQQIAEIFVGFTGLATGFAADIAELGNLIKAFLVLVKESFASFKINSPLDTDVLLGKKELIEIDSERGDRAAEQFIQKIDEIDERMRVRSQSIQESFKLITQQSELSFGGMKKDAEEFEQVISGLTFDEFQEKLSETALGGIDDFELLKAKTISAVRDMGVGFDEGYINVLRSAGDETQLFERLFLGAGAGIIQMSELIGATNERTADTFKFQEDNDFDYSTPINKVTEAVNYQKAALETGLGVILRYKDATNQAASAVSVWETDLGNVEKAIEITNKRIEDTGDPTGELSQRLEDLTWYQGRLTDRVYEGEDAWAGMIATTGNVERQLEELDRLFKEGKIGPEEYAARVEDLSQKTEELQDPFAQMVGDIGKIGESMAEGIEAFKDLLRELGLLKDETGEPIEANFTSNARDTADDIGNVGEKVDELPDEKPVSIISVLSGQNELEDYEGDLKDLPEEVLTKLLADPRNASENTQAVLEEALIYARGEYRAELYAETREANENVADLTTNSLGFVEGGPYEASLTANAEDALSDIDTALTRVGVLIAGSPYTVTLDANIQPLIDGVAAGREYLPSSPAEKGPLAFTPSWDWLFEGLAGSAESYTDDALNRVKLFVDTAQGAVNLLTSTLEGLTALIEGSSSIPANLGEEGSYTFIDPLIGFINNTLDNLAELSTAFREEALTHANSFIQTANSAVGLISAAFESLVTILEGPQLPDLSTVGSDDFLDPVFDFISEVTSGITELGTAFTPESLVIAQTFATASTSILELMSVGAETLAALSGIRPNLQNALSAVEDIKFVIEAAMLAVGDTAAVMNSSQGDVDHPSARGEGFVGAAGVFAAEAEKVANLLTAAVEFMTSLHGLESFNLEGALEAVTKIKFVIEHMMLSIGDTAAVMNSSGGDVDHPSARGQGFVGAAAAFAESAEAVVGLLANALEFISQLSEFEGTFNLEAAKDFASNLKFLIEHIILSIGDTVVYLESIRSIGFVEGIEEFSNAVNAAVSALTSTLDFIVRLNEVGTDILISSRYVRAVVAALSRIALDIATSFDGVAQTFKETVEGSIEAFASAVESATGSLAAVLDFLINISENMDRITVSSDQTHAYAAALAGIALDLADIFEYVAEIWSEQGGETISGSIEKFSSAVQGATGGLGATLTFLVSLSESIEKVTLSSDQVSNYARELSERAIDIAEAFNAAVAEWNGEVHPEAENLANAISTSLGAIGNVLSFLGSLTDAINREEGSIDFGSSIKAIASQLAERGREAAQAFIDVVRTWTVEAEVQTHVEETAKVIQDSFGALNAVISFMNAIASDDFQIRGGQLRQAARQIAELGVNVGNIFAEVGGSLSEDSRAGLTAYAAWFDNIQGIFDFLADIQSKTPDAIQNAYTFRDAAREIAAAIQTGTDALMSIGQLADLSYGGGFSPPSSNTTIPDNNSFNGGQGNSGNSQFTVNLEVDGEVFQTFIVDTVNKTIEETF